MGTNPADSIHSLFKESRSVIHLPQELITEILVCLPVKSLLKFKCVSKAWLSLISDPQFISSHFSKSSSSMVEADGLNLELLFATETSMNKCSLHSALHDAHPSLNVCAIEFTDQTLHPIVGIINGLVCLNLNGTDLCVWNPALNKIKHFNVHPEAPSDGPRAEYFFSFGYDVSNDDYKVVCLQTVQGNVFDAEVRIYSLKSDSWRRIDQLNGYYLPHPGVFANGNIYWSGDLFAIRNRKNLSLDMSSEKFAELQPPKYDAGVCSLRMGVSVGRPFVLCCYYNGMKVDLWVLDKNGVEESWCKLVSIPYTVVDHTLYCFNYRVLCISSYNEIVLGDKHGLIVYNWKKNESRNIKLVVDIRTHWGIAAYVESLVWPDYA